VSNNVILITPPDKIFNQNPSCLLIYPNDSIRKEFNDILLNSNNKQNVYLYNDENNIDVEWLLTTAKMCDFVIFDYDNSPEHVRVLGSYLISLPHTYWLTSDDWMLYNKLSTNRIYSLDAIETLIGGTFEEL